MMDTLVQDVRFSIRSLGRSPGFTAVAIFTLALGLGANLAVFSIVNAVLVAPIPFEHPGELVVLWGNVQRTTVERRGASLPDYFDWKAQSRSYRSMAAYWEQSVTLDTGAQQQTERLNAEVVDAAYFATLGIQPAAGQVFTDGTNAPVAVLSHGLWQRRFGSDPAIVGRSVRLDSSAYTIAAVMPRGFRGASDAADLWLPLHAAASRNVLQDRGSRWFPVIARLAPGSSRESASAELAAICASLERAHPATNEKRGAEVASLTTEIAGALQPALLAGLAAVGFVLLVACANVANLLIARAEKRQKEMIIREALGAGLTRILRQLVTEGLVLAILGTAAGGLVAVWGVPAILAASPVQLPSFASVRLDPVLALFAAALTIATGVVLGLAPALHTRASQFAPGSLAGGDRSTGTAARQRLRNVLVIAEIALTLVLLVGAGLLIRTVQRTVAVHPGFEATNLLTLRISLPPAGNRNTATVAERIRAVSGVASVSFGSDVPLSGGSGAVFYGVKDHPNEDARSRPRAYLHRVTPGFFQTLGIPLLSGRDFRQGETGAVIISEGVAKRFWPDADPIGRQLHLGRTPTAEAPWLNVIGVAAETRFRALPRNPTPDPDLYLRSTDDARQFAAFVRTRVSPSAMFAPVRAALLEIEPAATIYNEATMEQLVSRQTAHSRFAGWLTGIFSSVALILAAVGVYGVVASSISRRRREIGIRMALGATAASVVAMIARQGLMLILPGLAIGLGLSLALSRLLAKLLYGVTASDPLTYCAAAALAGIVALFATLMPARRATRVDPASALRME